MNKPVAWIEAYNRGFNDCLAKFVDTYPVKELTLTDEEIEELIWNTTDMKDFAKAILRKAQEK